MPRGQSAELVDERAFRYLRLQFKDDVLIGATAIGLTEHVGVLRGLIEGRVRLGPWKDRLLRGAAAVRRRLSRARAGRGLTPSGPMQVTLKLYASLADHLPADARRTHGCRSSCRPARRSPRSSRGRTCRRSCATSSSSTASTFRRRSARRARCSKDDELAIWPPIAGG